MSEPAVDVNSRTSLARQWWKLQKEDFTKKGVVATTVLNWGFAALSIWMYIGPHFESRGAENSTSEIAQLKQDLTNAISRADSASLDAEKNRAAYETVEQRRAMLAAELDAIHNAKEAPKQEAKASIDPPINKVKVRKVPVSPKADPTTWEQFVAWYEKNVGAPGVN